MRAEELLSAARNRLQGLSASPRLDAEVLLCHTFGLSKVDLIKGHDIDPQPPQLERFEALVAQRQRGVPVAMLTGRREFWSLDLEVTTDTLVPRPETELLVEQALQRVPSDAALSICDLGTGSGAVAIAIASERSRARIVATDISESAARVAQRNAHRLGLANIEFRVGDWFDCLDGECFDIIVSNPPYIRRDDPNLEHHETQHEPAIALFSADAGFAALDTIIRQSPSALRHGGWLLLEHGFDQSARVSSVLSECGFDSIVVYHDSAGHPRVTESRWR